MIEKYLSQGYHCIPCLKASKASALEKGYSTIDYGEKGITQEQADVWDKKFPIQSGYGLGLLCGDASRTVGIDIDSNDVELARLLPESPAVKKGFTGETRFFQKPNFLSRTIVIKPEIVLPKGTKDQVEFLSNGRYTLLPPSIHEDTKQPYIWIGEDQLIYLTPDDLPVFDEGVLDSVRDYYARKYGYSKEKRKSIDLSGYHPPEKDRVAHGSHDRIKQITATLIGKELPVEIGVKELLDYDREHHGPLNYFKDKTRGPDASADEETNALRFYTNMLFTINKERAKRADAPHKFLYAFNEVAPPRPIITETKKEYPRARGFMADFQKYCDLMSNGKQDALSLGGALALMSVLCANRFRTQAIQFDVRSNMYLLNLARSGVGKNVSQSLISDLLESTSLLGSNSYKSGTSIIQGLPEQQERLNVMDECAAFLKSVAEGEGFQQEINDVLSNLFSCSNRYFAGISTAGSGDKYGACYNPSVSLLGSTTLYGFKNSVNNSMGAKGLMPRFLVFWQFDVGSFRVPSRADIERANNILKSLQSFTNKLIAHEKRVAVNFTAGLVPNVGTKYDPEVIPMTDAAHSIYIEYARKYFPKNNEQESFEDAFRNRFAELAVKCALLDAVSLGLDEISEDSIKWGIDVVEACWANMRSVYEQTSAENYVEKNALKVFEVIKQHPNGVSLSELTNLTRWLKSKERKEILEDLIESNKIGKDLVRGKTKTTFKYSIL
jgi:hypothetical protein